MTDSTTTTFSSSSSTSSSSSSVTMLSDRRRQPQDIPIIELAVDLFFGIACQTCHQVIHKNNSKCSSCGLVHYCSKQCQRQDWPRHKKEEGCLEIQRIRQSLQHIKDKINRQELRQRPPEMGFLFGTQPQQQQAFAAAPPGSNHRLSRSNSSTNIDNNNKPDTAFEFLAGYFMGDAHTTDYMNGMLDLKTKLQHVAETTLPTAWAWEKVLEVTVEAKRLTHCSLLDLVDHAVVAELLKLHRDDDVVAYVQYWLDWRSRENLVDDRVLHSGPGEWPFSMGQPKGCRLVDVMDKIESFTSVDSYDIDIRLVVALLVVKARLITVYSVRSAEARAFLELFQTDSPTKSNTRRLGLELPDDVQLKIVSFLKGGDDACQTHVEQVRQAHRIMDYLDNCRNPHALASLLDPSLAPTCTRPCMDESFDADMIFNMPQFLEQYGGSQRVVDTIKCMVRDRSSRGQDK